MAQSDGSLGVQNFQHLVVVVLDADYLGASRRSQHLDAHLDGFSFQPAQIAQPEQVPRRYWDELRRRANSMENPRSNAL